MSKRQQAPGELEDVRAFVNTRDLERGQEDLSSASALCDWLAEHELVAAPVRATNEDLRTAREVREALRALLEAKAHGAPAGDAAATLDAAARRAGPPTPAGAGRRGRSARPAAPRRPPCGWDRTPRRRRRPVTGSDRAWRAPRRARRRPRTGAPTPRRRRRRGSRRSPPPRSAWCGGRRP